jgi:multidrug efflux pump subunit AcrB
MLSKKAFFSLLLVVGVLMFFLGLRNALFVGIAIPLSMLLSFVILDAMGITLNMIVLFSLILALGMLVDNAIVIVENFASVLDKVIARTPVKHVLVTQLGDMLDFPKRMIVNLVVKPQG